MKINYVHVKRWKRFIKQTLAPIDCGSGDEKRAADVGKCGFLWFLRAVDPLGNGWSGERRVAWQWCVWNSTFSVTALCSVFSLNLVGSAGGLFTANIWNVSADYVWEMSDVILSSLLREDFISCLESLLQFVCVTLEVEKHLLHDWWWKWCTRTCFSVCMMKCWSVEEEREAASLWCESHSW